MHKAPLGSSRISKPTNYDYTLTVYMQSEFQCSTCYFSLPARAIHRTVACGYASPCASSKASCHPGGSSSATRSTTATDARAGTYRPGGRAQAETQSPWRLP